MSDYVDEAVVLRRVNYSESDRILTLLTRQHGKVGAIARGVRKPRSKLASHTDLFVRSQVQLARGRGGLEVLTQAQRLRPWVTSDDPLRLCCAAVCAELADRVLESNVVDEPTYLLLVTTLQRIMADERDPRSALIWFAQQMIDGLGYAPQLRECAACAQELPQQAAGFSVVSGGLLCPQCSEREQGTVACSVRVIKVLRVMAAGAEEVYQRLRLGVDDLSTLDAIVERELGFHLERRLRSYEVLRALSR